MEKRNKLMEQCRKSISPEVKEMVDLSVQMADRIFDILEEKNITQREFAKLLGKNESEISKWLSGTHNFTLNTIAKIQAITNISVIKVQSKPIQNNVNAQFDKKVSIKSERPRGVKYINSSMVLSFDQNMKGVN